VIPLFLCILLLVSPCTADVMLFSPASGSVSSERIKDITDVSGDVVAFATDNGLSLFNGSWRIVHVDRANPLEGPLGDFLLAVEADEAGRLWIGYTNGLQIWDGASYTTIDDQQLLKNLNIIDLLHRDGEMWVATGNAGLHRYAGGEWTWFRPHGPTGPGCYEVSSIAVDYTTGTLFAGSQNEGIWQYREDLPAPRFEAIRHAGMPESGLIGLQSDPFGGVYLFNATVVGRIDSGGRYERVLSSADLPGVAPVITAIAPATGGGLVLGTDAGIVFWKDGAVALHLTKRDGTGSNYIRKVYVDNAGRWWFATPAGVGYYTGAASGPVIGIEAPAVPVETGVEVTVSPASSPVPVVMGGNDTAPEPGLLDGIFETILGFLRQFWKW
jgi:ligand-binding sensor domain-containing protein